MPIFVNEDGEQYNIPEEQRQQALDSGLHPALPMSDKQGNRYLIPAAKMKDAMQAGLSFGSNKAEDVGTATAAARGFNQGATLGFAPRLYAGLGAASEKGGDLLKSMGLMKGPQTNQSFGDLYNQGLGQGQEQMAETREQHPIATGTGQLAGNVLTGVATGGMASPMVQGAAMGGATGLGESKDLASLDALKNMATGAGAGAAGGKTAELVGKGLSSVANNFRTNQLIDRFTKQADKMRNAGNIEDSLAMKSTIQELKDGHIDPEDAMAMLPGNAPSISSQIGQVAQQLPSKGKMVSDLMSNPLDKGKMMGAGAGFAVGGIPGAVAGYFGRDLLGAGKSLGTNLIEKATRYTPPVAADMMQRGAPLAAIHTMLQQTDPQYRKATLTDKEETDNESEQ